MAGANGMQAMLARWRWIALLAAVGLASAATDGRAQSKTDSNTLFKDEGTRIQRSNKIWSGNDDCGKQSFRKFPDFTAEAAVQRDAYMRDCLRKRHLPPRNDLAQPLKPGS